VKKQLLMQIASENAELDEAEINRRIEDYRYDLTVYAYEKQYMIANLDTAVTEAQINEYYEQNKDNFELKQNIVKAMMMVVPKNSPRLSQVRKLIDDKDNLDQLKEMAPNVATNYYLSDTAWIDFEELIANTPFMEEISNKMEVLRRNRLLESSDENNFYFIKVYDYKLSSDMSPLSFVKQRIRDIIINRRRVELRRRHENEILKQAEKDNNYEIFIQKPAQQ
jgi:hypothetical protein